MIFEFWQEHHKGFLDLLRQGDFSPQEIARYRAMIKRLVTRGLDGTWESYDDASNYYKERTDLAEVTRHVYFSMINKLYAYHLNGELPMHRIRKRHFPESDHSKGELNLLPAYERLDIFISWDSYEDIWKWYQSNDHQDGYLHEVRRIIGLLANFHIYGLFPNNGEVQNPLCLRPSAYSNLNHEFRSVVDFGCQVEEKRSLKPSTVYKNQSEISLLLYSLQISGEDSLSKITECGVASFFTKTANIYTGIRQPPALPFS